MSPHVPNVTSRGFCYFRRLVMSVKLLASDLQASIGSKCGCVLPPRGCGRCLDSTDIYSPLLLVWLDFFFFFCNFGLVGFGSRLTSMAGARMLNRLGLSVCQVSSRNHSGSHLPVTNCFSCRFPANKLVWSTDGL